MEARAKFGMEARAKIGLKALLKLTSTGAIG
jgi:hypothetical protein